MMVETFSLSAKKRENSKNSARSTRFENCVPAVVYGKGVDPVSIAIDNSDILRTYRKAGQSSLIDLDIEGKTIKVLIHKLELNPVKNTIQHVDFYAVNLKEKTTVSVPFNFIGESPAIKNLGGIFMREHDTIDIRCLPTEIPSEIEVDISAIEEIGGQITVADLNLDTEKYEIMNLEPETMICSVAAPRHEVIEEEAPADEMGEGEEVEGAEGEEKSESEEKKPEEGGKADEKKE